MIPIDIQKKVYWYCYHGDLDKIRQIIKNDDLIDYIKTQNKSLVTRIFMSNNIEFIKLLLDNNIKFTITTFFEVLRDSNITIEAIELLLLKFDLKNDIHNHILLIIAQYCCLEDIIYLTKKYYNNFLTELTDINNINYNKKYIIDLLGSLCESKDLDIIKYIIEEYNIGLLDSDIFDEPIKIAYFNDDIDIIKYLMSKGGDLICLFDTYDQEDPYILMNSEEYQKIIISLLNINDLINYSGYRLVRKRYKEIYPSIKQVIIKLPLPEDINLKILSKFWNPI